MKKAGSKPTINLGIAKSYQLAGQLVGLQLSIANILALLVSAASVIAGATTLAVQQFPDRANWPIWIAAGGIGTGLALLIEGLTLSALIRIRVAARVIAEVEEKFREVREKRLDGLDLPDPAATNYLLLKKRYQEARKLIERDVRHTRKQQTQQSRRDRWSSRLLAIGGCLASMCAGGLFYHSILVGLGPLVSLGLSAIFTLAVTGTFVSSEVFKDLQSQAIRENFANGDLAESAMRQETRLQSLWAVHAQIATYLHSTEAQQAIAEGGKLLVTSILEEVHQDLHRQIAKPGPAMQTPYLERHRSLSQPAAEKLEFQPEQESSDTASREPSGDAPNQAMLDRSIQGYAEQSFSLASDKETKASSREEQEPGQSEQKAMDSSLELADLDMVERAMLRALEQAAPETRAELLRLAQTEPLEAITLAVHERFPGYATLLTRERVARVMATILQSLDTRPDAFLDHSLATGYTPAIAGQKKNDHDQRQASGYDQSDEQSRSRAIAHHRGVAHSSDPDNGSGLIIHTIHPLTAHVAQEAPGQSPVSGHRQRIKAAMEQAQREGGRLSYQEIAEAAGVGYSTVKKYAHGIRQELQAVSNQE